LLVFVGGVSNSRDWIGFDLCCHVSSGRLVAVDSITEVTNHGTDSGGVELTGVWSTWNIWVEKIQPR